MPHQESLFGEAFSEDASSPEPLVKRPELASWRVDLLRSALDRRGLVEVSERQRAIESIVGRTVARLHELTDAEATHALEALSVPDATRASSSWDDRDEVTWIDRL